MPTYYVDPAAAGSNDGSTWVHAWTSIQSAFDTATAGDVVYCRGTQTLAATLDVDTQSGSVGGGWIRFIGCNALGNNDGTKFVVNANGGSYHAITPGAAGAQDYYWFENFEFKNTAAGNYDGIGSNTSGQINAWVFVNCSLHDVGRSAFRGGFNAYTVFIKCSAYNCGADAIYSIGTMGWLLWSRVYNNTGSGVFSAIGSVFGSIIDHNGDDGIESPTHCVMVNSVLDANADDAVVSNSSLVSYLMALGCRITNNGDGLNFNSKIGLYGWCYFDDNVSNNILNGAVAVDLSPLGVSSNLADQADTECGYVDENDPEDYNLVPGASLRRVAIAVGASA